MIRIIKKLTLILVPLVCLLASLQTASAYYNPGVQRWINRDPVGDPGFEATRGRRSPAGTENPNQYCFVHNSPCSAQDPYGLSEFSDCLANCDKDLGTHLHQTCEAMRVLPPYGAASGAIVGGSTRGFLGWGIAGLRPILLGGVAGTVVGTLVGFLAPIVSVPVDLGRWMICVNNCALTHNPGAPWPASYPDPF